MMDNRLCFPPARPPGPIGVWNGAPEEGFIQSQEPHAKEIEVNLQPVCRRISMSMEPARHVSCLKDMCCK